MDCIWSIGYQIHTGKGGTRSWDLLFRAVLTCRFLVQILRVTNPLATNISSILVFGSQLLALTEDGRRMLIWNATGGDY